MASELSVNWFRRNVEASSIYYPPESFLSVYKPKREKTLKPNANVLACPAVLKRRSTLFVIRCPYDLRLRYKGDPGEGHIHVMHPGTSLIDSKIKSIFSLSRREDWADSTIPVLQLMTPYVFLSEMPVDILQLNNPMSIGAATGWRLLEGQYPIDKWMRPLSFALEWVDTSLDINLRRGDPWFALEFRSRQSAEDKIVLSEIEEDGDLANRVLRNSGVTSYIKGTSKLFHE